MKRRRPSDAELIELGRLALVQRETFLTFSAIEKRAHRKLSRADRLSHRRAWRLFGKVNTEHAALLDRLRGIT